MALIILGFLLMFATIGYMVSCLMESKLNGEYITKTLDEFCIETQYNWNHQDWENLIRKIKTKIQYSNFTFYNVHGIKVRTILQHDGIQLIGDYLEKKKKDHFQVLKLIKETNERLGVESDPNIDYHYKELNHA